MSLNQPQLGAEMREKLYNILANFANHVDDCHSRGVEPDCNNEINLIEKVLATALEEQRIQIYQEIEDDFRLRILDIQKGNHE